MRLSADATFFVTRDRVYWLIGRLIGAPYSGLLDSLYLAQINNTNVVIVEVSSQSLSRTLYHRIAPID